MVDTRPNKRGGKVGRQIVLGIDIFIFYIMIKIMMDGPSQISNN